MAEEPEISVIIPTYNRAEMVCACVSSVLGQEGIPLEVVIVDDCSPDRTGVLVEERFGRDRLQFLTEIVRTVFLREIHLSKKRLNVKTCTTHNYGDIPP